MKFQVSLLALSLIGNGDALGVTKVPGVEKRQFAGIFNTMLGGKGAKFLGDPAASMSMFYC
jgi:hypothetical protein